RPWPILVGVVASAAIIFGPLPLGALLIRICIFVLFSALIGYLFLGRGLRTALGGLFGAGTVASLALVLAVPAVVPQTGWWWAMGRVLMTTVLVLVWLQLVFGLRGALCRHAYRRTLFREQGGRAPLGSYKR